MAIPANNLQEYDITVFVIYGHLLIIFYLLVATALPDDIQNKKIDLQNYYFRNNGYFWGLMTVVIVLAIIVNVIRNGIHMAYADLFNIIANIILIAFTTLLALTKKQAVHVVLLLFFIMITLFEIMQKI